MSPRHSSTSHIYTYLYNALIIEGTSQHLTHFYTSDESIRANERCINWALRSAPLGWKSMWWKGEDTSREKMNDFNPQNLSTSTQKKAICFHSVNISLCLLRRGSSKWKAFHQSSPLACKHLITCHHAVICFYLTLRTGAPCSIAVEK